MYRPPNIKAPMTQKTPTHIAVIMDGNGRWAQSRGLPRTAGHKRGAEAARKVVENAAELGVKYITLFGFSSENWSRPDSEVSELMKLLRYYLRSETAELHKKNARLRVIGDRERLDDDIIDLIDHAQNLTKANGGINVIIALNYGGRQDILSAVKAMTKNVSEGYTIPDDKLESVFSGHLSTSGIPDPDLLIRTSGEQRISNFLLWQCAYSEMVFTDTYWPDFGMNDLKAAIAEYQNRDRRYGGLDAGHETEKGTK